jgi:hypothetical protein
MLRPCLGLLVLLSSVAISAADGPFATLDP